MATPSNRISLGWSQFLDEYSSWLHDRFQDAENVCRIPATVHLELRTALDLTGGEYLAEAAFDSVCGSHSSIGVSGGGLIQCDYLLPGIDREPALLEGIHKYWNRGAIGSAAALLKRSQTKHLPRMRAVAGRRIADPLYLLDRDALRKEWERLPVRNRPKFPLRRLAEGQGPPRAGLSLNNRILRFVRHLDEFLSRWELRKLVTWEIPIPTGFEWPKLRIASIAGPGNVDAYTPPAFPVQDHDHLSGLILEEHRDDIRAIRLSDPHRWMTYARMFELDHWQRVIETRYANRPRPKNFSILVDGILESILRLSTGRIGKLRRQLRDLRSGERKTLSSSR